MNYKMIFKSLGTVLCIEAACMLPSLVISFIYKQNDSQAFLLSMLLLLVTGFLMILIKPVTTNIYTRDGFAIVALGWLMISFFGALPFFFSGAIPSFSNAIFESSSGFTTTGASILTEIESLPKGILFWRSFTHWIGGMGVLILTLAILPSIKANTLHIMRAESPGPNPGKIVPQIGRTVKIMYGIYIILTTALILLLLFAGMPFYDSLIHAFGTAGTGGFSNKNVSVAAYDSISIEVIITIFMLLFGTNFSLYFSMYKGNIKSFIRNEEFRFYIGTVIVSIILITIDINGNVFNSLWESLRFSSFQVSSIITTTGYVTTDFNVWPVMSKCILLLLMFIGASAGSTGGGMKCIRILLLVKIVKREVHKILHPRSVYSVKIGGNMVDEQTLTGVMAFFFIYILIFVSAVLVVSLDGYDLATTLSSVAATIGNIGPGLELVGPLGNYSGFSVLSKVTLTFCMIVGRLEIYPVLLLFTKAFWKRVNI